MGRATDCNLPRRLLAAYEASPTRDARDARIAACTTSPGVVFEPGRTPPSMWSQTAVLTQRFLTNNARDIGVFWMRLAMYFMLCLCIAFIYFRMDHSWRNVYSRAALLFFCVAFLCFMSSACTLLACFVHYFRSQIDNIARAVSGFPAFVEDMKVFTRERLNGYYGVSTFVIANTLACAPALPALGAH